ncbi:hypothetical protein [Pontibacter sp. HSC-36F09]|uniref:hypothetical protein n=1 Tax=Pontibacter sp. HSC-36F09 TaxID=2910966 RepID=UPI0020A14D6B|nr:hypothetical protein [Pontibacter sp. HSC-36F09]MCP2043176.1 hypothetical protein [Pontibacter sp. HSC-36F09]
MKRNLLPIVLLFLFTSCEKEESIDYKETLTEQEWEQVTGIVDNVYYGNLKQFHRIKFRTDNTYEIILDYGGVSELPDPVKLDTLYGSYSIDKDIIDFHGPVDTLYVGNERTETKVFINSWKITALNTNTLRTEPITDYSAPEQPEFTIGMNSYLFKPLQP